MDRIQPFNDDQHSPHATREAENQSKESNEQIPSASASPQTKPSPPEQDIRGNPKKDWWDKAKPFVELSGLILLAVYTGFTIAMYFTNKEAADAARNAAETANRGLKSSDDSFRKTLDQMKAQTAAQKQNANASKDQAITSKRAVETAKQSLEATIDNFHLDQRPWVTPFQFHLEKELEYNRDIKVTIWVEDSGKTPALDIIPATRTLIWSLEPPEPNLSGITRIVSRGILSPGFRNFSFDTEGTHVKPTLPDVAAYQTSLKRIWIHGLVRYQDSSNIWHWTKFCVWHKYGMSPDDFSYCEHGNDVDRQEPDKQSPRPQKQ